MDPLESLKGLSWNLWDAPESFTVQALLEARAANVNDTQFNVFSENLQEKVRLRNRDFPMECRPRDFDNSFSLQDLRFGMRQCKICKRAFKDECNFHDDCDKTPLVNMVEASKSSISARMKLVDYDSSSSEDEDLNTPPGKVGQWENNDISQTIEKDVQGGEFLVNQLVNPTNDLPSNQIDRNLTNQIHEQPTNILPANHIDQIPTDKSPTNQFPANKIDQEPGHQFSSGKKFQTNQFPTNQIDPNPTNQFPTNQVPTKLFPTNQIYQNPNQFPTNQFPTNQIDQKPGNLFPSNQIHQMASMRQMPEGQIQLLRSQNPNNLQGMQNYPIPQTSSQYPGQQGIQTQFQPQQQYYWNYPNGNYRPMPQTMNLTPVHYFGATTATSHTVRRKMAMLRQSMEGYARNQYRGQPVLNSRLNIRHHPLNQQYITTQLHQQQLQSQQASSFQSRPQIHQNQETNQNPIDQNYDDISIQSLLQPSIPPVNPNTIDSQFSFQSEPPAQNHPPINQNSYAQQYGQQFMSTSILPSVIPNPPIQQSLQSRNQLPITNPSINNDPSQIPSNETRANSGVGGRLRTILPKPDNTHHHNSSGPPNTQKSNRSPSLCTPPPIVDLTEDGEEENHWGQPPPQPPAIPVPPPPSSSPRTPIDLVTPDIDSWLATLL